MTNQFNLIAAGNTYNPCLLILKSKGYEVSAEELSQSLLWSASKANHCCSAYSPPELLGIVVLWETFGTNWSEQEPYLIGDIMEKMAEKGE